MGNQNNVPIEKKVFWIQNQNPIVIQNEAKEKARLRLSIIKPSPSKDYTISITAFTQNSKSIFLGSTSPLTASSSQKLDFHETFILEYYFEKQQRLNFQIQYGASTKTIETTLGNIMGSRGQIFREQFGNNGETLQICGDTLKDDNTEIEFKVKAQCDKSLYFLIKAHGSNEQNILMPLYKSEVLRPINEQYYESVRIPYMYIGSTNEYSNYNISFEVYDHHNQNKKLGEKTGSLNTFFRVDNKIELKTHKVHKFEFECTPIKKYKFLDYLRGGMQIALIFAIDFTSSNGEVTNPDSLHYICSNSFNDYETAIYECGKIVAAYDYDQLFPVYGYGAQLFDGQTHHCFPLTFTDDPNVQGIEGVLAVYKSVLPQIKLFGPTNFAPIIRKINNEVKEDLRQGKIWQYNIIMFLTDGQISDIDETIDELVEASFLPISVIIIGIGNNDFRQMDILDADENPLYNRKQIKAARDLVQFVPFNQFRHDSQKLPEEVLEEVPRQVIEYYQMKNIPPREPIIQINSIYINE